MRLGAKAIVHYRAASAHASTLLRFHAALPPFCDAAGAGLAEKVARSSPFGRASERRRCEPFGARQAVDRQCMNRALEKERVFAQTFIPQGFDRFSGAVKNLYSHLCISL